MSFYPPSHFFFSIIILSIVFVAFIRIVKSQPYLFIFLLENILIYDIGQKSPRLLSCCFCLEVDSYITVLVERKMYYIFVTICMATIISHSFYRHSLSQCYFFILLATIVRWCFDGVDLCGFSSNFFFKYFFYFIGFLYY